MAGQRLTGEHGRRGSTGEARHPRSLEHQRSRDEREPTTLRPCPIRVMIITGEIWSVTAHWEADELAGGGR